VRALHVTREAAIARAGFDHDERIRLAQRAPLPVEGARNTRAEQRTYLGARDEVATGTPRAVTGFEEPGTRLVQRSLDEPVERDRALAPDQAGDRVGGRTG
jgi:hypothetical protein